ncbi:hypothetical protein Dimus_009998 [Dionaea muscipula]
MSAINETSTSGSSTGLIISNTKFIQSFLKSAAGDPYLPQFLRNNASSLSFQPCIPYRSLRSVWSASDPSTRPALSGLFRDSDFILSSPKAREKSEELQARLKKLEELAESKAYEELVKDIMPRKAIDEPFSSYKNQIGFGLHVLVTMATGYMVGYAAFRALFSHNPIMSTAGGILGFVLALLVETLLFIIKTSSIDQGYSASSSSTSLKLKKNQ